MPSRDRTFLITGGPLLNFYKRDMVIINPISGENWVWTSVEHYFQACKALYLKLGTNTAEFVHYHTMEEIRSRPSPADAKKMGRELDISLPLWNRAAVGYMLQGQIAKFSQHEDLRAQLLATGSKKLVEHRPDPIWGDNMDGTGKNLCGRTLMIVRRMARDWK